MCCWPSALVHAAADELVLAAVYVVDVDWLHTGLACTVAHNRISNSVSMFPDMCACSPCWTLVQSRIIHAPQNTSCMVLLLLLPLSVSAYVTHGVFPKESWNKFKADNGGEQHLLNRNSRTASTAIVLVWQACSHLLHGVLHSAQLTGCSPPSHCLHVDLYSPAAFAVLLLLTAGCHATCCQIAACAAGVVCRGRSSKWWIQILLADRQLPPDCSKGREAQTIRSADTGRTNSRGAADLVRQQQPAADNPS